MTDDYVQKLVEILERLRAPDGCPWDRQQTHQTLKRFLIEETGELLDAIDDADDAAMIDELGDVLLQIVFHCQIGREQGRFDLQDAARSECEKMIRRHPHVFANDRADHAEDVIDKWERIKRAEKGETLQESGVDGVPRSLPALHRAQKMLRKAARAGLEATDTADVVARLDESVAGVRAVLQSADQAALAAELGTLFLGLVDLCRWHDLEAEDVLQQAVRAFEKRFRSMEGQARAAETSLSDGDRNALFGSRR